MSDRDYIISCTECPCLFWKDIENDFLCALGYNVDSKTDYRCWESDMISRNCKLLEIRTEDKILKPKILKEEDQ